EPVCGSWGLLWSLLRGALSQGPDHDRRGCCAQVKNLCGVLLTKGISAKRRVETVLRAAALGTGCGSRPHRSHEQPSKPPVWAGTGSSCTPRAPWRTCLGRGRPPYGACWLYRGAGCSSPAVVGPELGCLPEQNDAHPGGSDRTFPQITPRVARSRRCPCPCGP
ncbi:Hypothetical predicted protein, partial [Lynx pardinus]